jgi:hypothetical protein
MSILKGMQPPTRKRECFVAAEAEKLSAEDKEILLNAVVDPNWSLTGLEKALQERGVMLTRSVIARHRSGLCKC